MANKYPTELNPYETLGIEENASFNKTREAFKQKMKNNDNPEYRLAYDMLSNKDNYIKKTNSNFQVKKKDHFYYAHVGGYDNLKELIKSDKKIIFQKDNLGRTLLYIAARNGYAKICSLLLDEGANINETQSNGSTPLHGANFYGQKEVVKLLVQYGAKSNIKNEFGLTPSEEELFTIDDFDNIIKKNCAPNYDYYNFFEFLKNVKLPNVFNKVSIFDKNKYEQKIKLFNKMENFTNLEKACMGAMMGMAIGDAMGARVEFEPLDYTYNKIKDMGNSPAGKFKLKPGQWTDDTSMGLCLADSIIENNGKFDPRDLMNRIILWWYAGYNNAFSHDKERKIKESIGLGGNIAGSIKQYIKEFGYYEYTNYGDKDVSGNGSVIRIAPVPICYYKDQVKALEIAAKQSKVTHKGEEADGCCQLVTFIIIKILNGEKLKDVLDNLSKQFRCGNFSVNCLADSKMEDDNPNRNWNWKDKDFKYSKQRVNKDDGYIGSYSMDAVAMALHILYYTNSFSEAVLKGVNLRGDADSLGAIIGQIAGAYYGIDSIPENWKEKIYEWDPKKEIELRGFILCHLFDI